RAAAARCFQNASIARFHLGPEPGAALGGLDLLHVDGTRHVRVLVAELPADLFGAVARGDRLARGGVPERVEVGHRAARDGHALAVLVERVERRERRAAELVAGHPLRAAQLAQDVALAERAAGP